MLVATSTITCVLLFSAFAETKKLPASFTACKVTDNSCLASSIESALKTLKNGLPELGVPSIDPMEVKTITIGEGSGAVHLVQNYADVKIFGFSDVTVKDASFDDAAKVIKFSTSHPKLEQKAKYDINGKILVLPVYGKGDSAVTLDKPTITHKIHFEESTKDGQHYYIPKKYDVGITLDKAHYHFDNLFDGDKALAGNVLTVINQEWKALFDDVLPGLQNSYSALFLSFANRIFSKVPAEEIFLK